MRKLIFNVGVVIGYIKASFDLKFKKGGRKV